MTIARTIHFIGQGFRFLLGAVMGAPRAKRPGPGNNRFRLLPRAGRLSWLSPSNDILVALFHSHAQGEPGRRRDRLAQAAHPRRAWSASSAAASTPIMPLGPRVMQKISRICREEMERAGAIELVDAAHPSRPSSGPRARAGARCGRSCSGWTAPGTASAGPREPEFVLGPTHEEVITPLVKGRDHELPRPAEDLLPDRNQVPQRDPARASASCGPGNSSMMDAYSFDADDAGAIKSYMAMKDGLRGLLPPHRRPRHRGRGRHRRHGRQLLPRVHDPGRRRRQRPLLQRGERLRGEPGKGRSALVPEGPGRRGARAGALEEFATPGVVTIAALEAAPLRRSRPTASSRPWSTSATASRSPSSCAGATSWRRPSWARSVSPSCGRRPRRRSSRSWARSPAAWAPSRAP